MPYSYKKYDLCYSSLAQYNYLLLLSDLTAPTPAKARFVFVAPLIYCHRFNPASLAAIPPQWVKLRGHDGVASGLTGGDLYILTNNLIMVPKEKVGEMVSCLNGVYIKFVKAAIKNYTNFCEDEE
jgi:hypothetical protein